MVIQEYKDTIHEYKCGLFDYNKHTFMSAPVRVNNHTVSRVFRDVERPMLYPSSTI